MSYVIKSYKKAVRFIFGKEKKIKNFQGNENIYQSIFENSVIGLYRTTPDGKIILANQLLLKKLGYSSIEELAKRNLTYEGFEPNYDRKQFIEQIESKGEVLGLEAAWKCFDGSSIYIRESAKAVKDSKGKILYYDGCIEDVTENRQVLEKLQESEKTFSDMFLKSPVSTVLTVPFKGIILDVNEAFIMESEYSREELIGSSLMDLNLFNDLRDRENILTILKEQGSLSDLEIRFQTKNGRKHYGLLSIVFIKLNGSICELSTVINITERKQTENILIETKDNYRIINEELNRTNQELLKAKEKAEESDRLKTAFLKNLSHEIRTPMNAIMGFSELLAKQYNNKEKLEKFSEIIQHRCSDLLDIINDLLDIAKIESGQLTVHFEPCNLNELFNELNYFFTEHQRRIGKTKIELSLHNLCEPTVNAIVTDKVKLKQIFINLLDNAFKFTEFGKIEGGCKFDGNNNLLFFLSDTGLGIPPDQQNKIFESFAQLDPAKNHTVSGTGLGLSIVRGLLNLLGGEIFLESKPGQGSHFSFSIPYKTIYPLNPDPIVTFQSVEINFPDKTILIVEDDQYNAEYIKEILTNAGLPFLHAAFGREAIEIASLQPVDLILMDIGLPDMTGYEASTQIRKMKPNIKIIAQTAYASHQERQIALEAGCSDYISKPTREDLLLSMVNKHLTEQ